MADCQWDRLPPELWQHIYEQLAQTVFLDSIGNHPYGIHRYLVSVPWTQYQILPLMFVCKAWKVRYQAHCLCWVTLTNLHFQSIVLPLFYKHIMLRNIQALQLLEALIAANTASPNPSFIQFIQTVHLMLPDARLASMQLSSILLRLPHLLAYIDISEKLEGGTITRIAPVLGASLREISIEIHDSLSFSFIKSIPSLRILHMILVRDDRVWVSDLNFAHEVVHPTLERFDLIVWEDYDGTWFFPFLARCSFSSLKSVRISSFTWNADLDSSYLDTFLDRHHGITNLELAFNSDSHTSILSRNFPVTTATFGPSMNDVDSVKRLSRNIQRLRLNHIHFHVLRDFIDEILAKPFSDLLLKEVWVHAVRRDRSADWTQPITGEDEPDDDGGEIGGEDAAFEPHLVRFKWRSLLAECIDENNLRPVRLLGLLLALNARLERRRPHPIRFVDSEGLRFVECFQ
jgi:hypothetical protein